MKELCTWSLHRGALDSLVRALDRRLELLELGVGRVAPLLDHVADEVVGLVPGRKSVGPGVDDLGDQADDPENRGGGNHGRTPCSANRV